MRTAQIMTGNRADSLADCSMGHGRASALDRGCHVGRRVDSSTGVIFSAFQLALVRQGWHRHVRPGGDRQPISTWGTPAISQRNSGQPWSAPRKAPPP